MNGKTRRCKAKLANGDFCGVPCLRGEAFCLGHSQSNRAKKARLKGAKRPKSYVSREELLRLLSKEIRLTEQIKDDKERMRLKSSLADKIIILLDNVENIKDLEKLILENK